MRNVIKLRNDAMPMIRARKSALCMHLRTEMAKDDDSGRIGAEKDGANEELEVL